MPNSIETYYGHVRTCSDAILIIQACEDGALPRLQNRLSERERQSIRSGSVFVWDEDEGGMRRWTDGRSWSSSRVNGRFLAYREMEKEPHQPDRLQNEDHSLRFKADGLIKQSFGITATTGRRLHLISYHSLNSTNSLRIPSSDPALQSICPRKLFFPRSLVNDLQNFSVFAREQAEAATSNSRSEPCVRPLLMSVCKSSLPSRDSVPTPSATPTEKALCSPHSINSPFHLDDPSNPLHEIQDRPPNLLSGQHKITDTCKECHARNSMSHPVLSSAPGMTTISPLSSSVRKSRRSSRETQSTHNKDPLLSIILS